MPELGKQPAPYTDSIIRALRDLIPTYVLSGHSVHDPFAGDGRKLAALCDLLGVQFTGTDLEPWRDADHRVRAGDSREYHTYPMSRPFSVVTSPTYNNGVNDHFNPQDASRRMTYRAAAGHELAEGNTGRWSGRHSATGERMYWQITREVVKHWPSVALVNVKNSIRRGSVYPLDEMWIELLKESYDVIHRYDVPCPGWRYGANRSARVDHETILVARRS